MSDLYPSIWWRADRAKLVDYSATVRGGKSVVTIKLTVSDPNELGHLIEQLEETKRNTAKAKQPAKPLLLTDRRGEEMDHG